MATRAAFLQDARHKVVFYYTPKHARDGCAPGGNMVKYSHAQIAETGQFYEYRRPDPSRVLAFIDYYNRTMAKPFKWAYTGIKQEA